MTRPDIRVLEPADRGALDAFLVAHGDTSLFLRSNLRAAGLRYEGQVFGAVYAGAFEDGRLRGVVAHCWNDHLLLQAPTGATVLARSAVDASGRPLRGLIGPWGQVCAVRTALGLDDVPVGHASREELLSLGLDGLIASPGSARVRRIREDDLNAFVAMRLAFCVEALGETRSESLDARCREDAVRLAARGDGWILDEGGQAVACCTVNARLPEVVQVGGVFVPPDLRVRGYGRTVVAGCLAAERAEGVRRALLFTANPAARRAYVGLGFEPVGEYGLVVFRDPITDVPP